MGTNGDEHRVEPLVKDIVKVVHEGVQPQLHAQINNVLHFAIHDQGGKPILGNSHPQHSAGHRQRLENGDRIPQSTQVLGSREAAGPGANDGHPLIIFDLARLWRHAPLE